MIRRMNPRGTVARGPAVLAAAVCVSLLVGLGSGPALAASNVTAVNGSAFGYWARNISFWGGVQPDTGPTPSVALASNASNSPQNASVASGTVTYGPAVLFTSDGIAISSSGSLGSTGFARSSTTINNVNKATSQPTTTGSEILTADRISSSCNATLSGVTGSTTSSYLLNGVNNGAVLRTDSGWDANDDGDYVDSGEHAPIDVAVGKSPALNATYYGHIHLSATSTDYFKVVFNEQSLSGGTRTVTAVHEYFGVTPNGNDPNSVLHGELILGRAVCGVTAV